MSYPNDWMQLNFNDQNPTNTPPTTTTSAAAPTSRSNNPAGGARPIRRRSRASRRTPTTLLNTDTTNFRAMVQQFTGSPATPAGAASTAAAAPQLAGMFDFTQNIAGNAPSNLYNQGRGAHLQYIPSHMHHQQQQQQQRHVFMVGDVHGGGGGGGGGGGAHAPPESSSPNESRDYDSYML